MIDFERGIISTVVWHVKCCVCSSSMPCRPFKSNDEITKWLCENCIPEEIMIAFKQEYGAKDAR